MLSSSWIQPLRRIGRRLGINRRIALLLGRGGYEDHFGTALMAEVRAGDTVWDIGANLGLYTQMFLDAAGGRVVAFEPTPACFGTLLETFSAEPRVSPMNMAAGATDGELYMSMDANPLAPTHHVVTDPGSRDERMIPVAVRSAGSVVEESPDLFPNLVKIDVEGHEGAVMDGMLPLLPDKRLHCVGIEVHFGLLDSRGEGHRPKQMEQVLKAHGFQVRWTDPSHLLAIR